MPSPSNINRALKELAAASKEAFDTLDPQTPTFTDSEEISAAKLKQWEVKFKPMIRNVVAKIEAFDQAIGRIP